jgi:flagellar basal body rod protein FlgG
MYSTYHSVEALFGPEGTLPAVSPVVEEDWTDYTQGALVATGNPLNVAIAGPGFFSVDRDGSRMYTRDGSFRLSPAGDLVTTTGAKLLDTEGKPIRLNADVPVDIDGAGVIRQAGEPVGRLAVVDFADRQSLDKVGSTYFRYDGTGAPAETGSKVEQGRLEGANVSPAETAVRLVDVMRQFEMLQRAVSLGSEMNKRALEEVAKIS